MSRTATLVPFNDFTNSPSQRQSFAAAAPEIPSRGQRNRRFAAIEIIGAIS